jgi:hypothetical protein
MNNELDQLRASFKKGNPFEDNRYQSNNFQNDDDVPF